LNIESGPSVQMEEESDEPLCLPADSLAFVQEFLRARGQMEETDPADGNPLGNEDTDWKRGERKK
jgi:hypothetical protein